MAGLREGDLKDTVLSKISSDEFEPKTGDSKDVIVIGYQVTESGVGTDLYNFINTGVTEYRDVEVSPNPNPEGYYMVFVEIDRNEKAMENIIALTTDITNISGELEWKGKTHLMDDYAPLSSEELGKHLIEDPDKYLTKEEFEDQKEMEATETTNTGIMEFLQQSTLDNADISENVLTMTKGADSAQLEIVGYGNKDIMGDLSISESALKPLDAIMRKFNSMLGEMRAVQIDENIVIFHPAQNTVLVTKQCSV